MNALLIENNSLPIYGIEDNNLINKEKGCLTYGFKVSYPGLYQKESGQIEAMGEILDNIFSVLDSNYIVHKQDWFFSNDTYNEEAVINESAMQRYNRIHFHGRKIRKQLSHIFITKVPESYIAFDSSNTNRFLIKKSKNNPLNG